MMFFLSGLVVFKSQEELCSIYVTGVEFHTECHRHSILNFVLFGKLCVNHLVVLRLLGSFLKCSTGSVSIYVVLPCFLCSLFCFGRGQVFEVGNATQFFLTNRLV